MEGRGVYQGLAARARYGRNAGSLRNGAPSFLKTARPQRTTADSTARNVEGLPDTYYKLPDPCR